ncbi:MAG: type II toxin-antitoxin system HipA family toxin [Gammaproteobacteria bacterium]|nr:type II toxin-antitoxin system HipA family toxin [Gammaproteobacteria bacterium]MDH5241149.1 type II toxin-antitoxin system HipA family toxin [Gammaproteobacteria bacterium]MDH5261220.1 type II toxin-antitoxin system HipA family toxin [Gammaproteobacteria bacterium]MDH5584093.1 type II toxin-antitoxin system HipA family toxin [Gammaproteobacteria bacterium]
MARTLNVQYDRELVGQLIQDDGGQMTFKYDASWLGKPEPIALSRSLPLREETFTQKECRGFFGGMLPEDDNRKIIARILGISDKNDFAMLEQIGGECAGAISFLPEDEEIPDDDDRYRDLADAELAKILRELPRRPLMAGQDGIRLSLAGAQDKIAVRIDDGKISIPRGSAPSSHVLKPAIDTYEGVVFNEAFCMALARAGGLNAAPVDIGKVEDIDYLLVERYDRIRDGEENIQRLHQEDFCQALGIPSEIKYQSEGGPSLVNCFDLIRDASSAPALDLIAMLDAVIFNLLIGNHDAHAKNFSLLYMPDRSVRLAPLYDLVSTVYYEELTNKMAMKIGKQPESALIRPEDVDQFAADAGLGAALARARIPALANRLLEEIRGIDKPNPVSEDVAKLIEERCKTYRSRFARK